MLKFSPKQRIGYLIRIFKKQISTHFIFNKTNCDMGNLITIKYSEGDSVYVVNPITGKAKLRTIVGCVIKSLKGNTSVFYAFERDVIVDGKDIFWTHESKVFDNIDDIIE